MNLKNIKGRPFSVSLQYSCVGSQVEDLVRENIDIDGKSHNQDELHDENKKQSQKYGQCKTGSFFGKLPEPPMKNILILFH